jgi:hypothetical protein
MVHYLDNWSVLRKTSGWPEERLFSENTRGLWLIMVALKYQGYWLHLALMMVFCSKIGLWCDLVVNPYWYPLFFDKWLAFGIWCLVEEISSCIFYSGMNGGRMLY